MIFQQNIIEKCKKLQKHIVLPEGFDEKIILSSAMFVSNKLGYITLLGEYLKIKHLFKTLNVNFDKERINVIHPTEYLKLHDFYYSFYTLRKHKGVSLKEAKNLLKHPVYFATMMVYKKLADGMVSGIHYTTSQTITPALQFIKTKKNINSVSSVFFMLLKNRTLLYSDCAIIPYPSIDQLKDIAISSYYTAQNFGITPPKIAMLSYSSGNSGQGFMVEKTKKATNIIKKNYPNIIIEGPIQYDAAVDQNVCIKKLPNSLIKGDANIFIFPDLNSGNITYKAVQRESECVAIGPILQGLNRPVNDLSRGASVEDIYNTIMVTAIQSSFL